MQRQIVSAFFSRDATRAMLRRTEFHMMNLAL
jgi:hypothetical protein